MADRNEALRLADAITDYSRLGLETEHQAKLRRMASHKDAAALLRQQAERIAELEKMQNESSEVEASLRDQLAETQAERDTLISKMERLSPTVDEESMPIVLMVYRWPDGSTQVRAPEIEDPAVAVDLLKEALKAMEEGDRVLIQ